MRRALWDNDRIWRIGSRRPNWQIRVADDLGSRDCRLQRHLFLVPIVASPVQHLVGVSDSFSRSYLFVVVLLLWVFENVVRGEDRSD